MTYDEKKRLLEAYRRTPQAISRLRLLIKELESEAEHITAVISGDGGGGYSVDTEKLQRCVEKLDDAKMRLLAEEAELSEKRAAVLEGISALEDERERAVLHGHYVQGKSFQALCFTMSYSRRQIFRILGRAINNIYINI